MEPPKGDCVKCGERVQFEYKMVQFLDGEVRVMECPDCGGLQ